MSEYRNNPDPNGLDDRFADWVDGRLGDPELRDLETELARDVELRRRAEEYRAVVEMVREHLAERPADEEPPADLVTGVLQRVRRERAPLFRLVPLVASLTAAAAALVLIVVLLNQPGGQGRDRMGRRDRPREVARYDAQDEEKLKELKEEQHDDVAPEKRPAMKKMAAEPRTVPDATVEQSVEGIRKQTANSNEVAKVTDGLTIPPKVAGKPAADPVSRAPAPAAPIEPARPGAGEKQRERMGLGGRGPERQADKDTGEWDASGKELDALRRITALVFPAPKPARSETTRLPRKEDLDRTAVAQRPSPDAEKKNKDQDAKLVAQVPVVVVQLSAPPALPKGMGTDARRRAEGKAVLGKEQPAAQGFLGYLQQQQQQPWGAVNNQVMGQARTVDVTGGLSQPQAGGGAAPAQAQGPVLPGDQLLLVSGSTPEVHAFFKQLKDFLAGSTPAVVVQQLPRSQLPQPPASFKLGARKFARDKKQEGAGEMSFYLVLRQAAR